jgi:hypothetical protein
MHQRPALDPARDYASLVSRRRPTMARSGSSKRQRTKTLTLRFNEQELEALRQMADRSGLPVSSHSRRILLNAPAPRAVRRPTVSHQVAARLLGELGRIADVIRDGILRERIDEKNPHIAAALRDLAEMRTVCFEALGREP